MITKQTAYDIWIAYSEIEKGEKLLAETEKEVRERGVMDLRDSFGRRGSLTLGIPSGENSHRLFDVAPKLAIEIIKAHIANKRAELSVINLRAKNEVE